MLTALTAQAAMHARPEASDGSCTVVDGDVAALCAHCKFPVGDFVALPGMQGNDVLHEECAAQRMLAEMRREEVHRKQQADQVKGMHRADFDIGWKAAVIPSNAPVATQLGCRAPPQGMCCLVAQEDQSVRVAEAAEAAAAVNLEYLAVALQVRRTEGREPLFSLDPVMNGGSAESHMQAKRFEPEWLAGTSVGEVMFQADYHLKELSFGQYEQPIVGMKSCFEYSEKDKDSEDWSGREWFVVRAAEVHMSDDQVLVPHFRMGVEARQQVHGPDGLEDAPLTRPDHPLVMYAETFTHYFDLIAERKSVVAQLREVAKASIMAKFLLESGARLEEAWFAFSENQVPVCCMEVPQLWNERYYAKIRVKDGAIDNCDRPNVHGLYGGVDFGIDRFRLSAPSRVATSVVAGRAVLGRPATSLMATSRPGLTMGPARQFARLAAPLSASLSMSTSAAKVGLGVPRVAAGLSMGVPQGVDLNLDRFNLSAAVEVGGRWAGPVQAAAPGVRPAVAGGAFWTQLGGEEVAAAAGPALTAEERSLFKSVFNPTLSDRRGDGDAFLPPSFSPKYLQKLRHLVRGEQTVRSNRRELFLSAEFTVENPGPCFPSSWKSCVEIEGTASKAATATKGLHARPDQMARAAMLRDSLQSVVPAFDNATEDGTRYRIYKLGKVEVRTIQELGAEEVVGMVFSVFAPLPPATGGQCTAGDHEWVSRCTVYVEKAADQKAEFHYFLAVETEAGDKAVVEKATGGAAQWADNPAGFEARISFAKVIVSEECRFASVRMGDLRAFCDKDLCEGTTSIEYVSLLIERARGNDMTWARRGARTCFNRLGRI